MAEGALPKVSVIIPVFNGTNYLREAIDSVLSQTYKNYEIIVVDDGSTDETWAVIQSYGSSLRGIQKENGGVASALNCGIRNATGDYIAWLSHDDLFLPEKLEHQVNFLREFRKFKACYTDYYVIDAYGRILKEVETPWYPRDEAIRKLFGSAYVHGSTMLIERTCFDRVGLFSEGLRYTQDTEMWLRLLRQFEVGRVPQKLAKGRSHPAQGSCNVKTHEAEAQEMYRQLFEEMGIEEVFPELARLANDPKIVATAYTWLGDTMAVHRRWYSFAEKQYRRAMAIDPSWRNPASLKCVANRARSILRPSYQRLRHVLSITLRMLRFKSRVIR
jgi:glycosyltransferase involved in cell wall biosynthesis